MTIEFQCTECGRPMRAPDGAAGKQGKCPQCGTVMPIPTPEPAVPRAQLTAEGKLQFPCPSCAAPVRTPAAAAGKRGKCPHCGDIMQIPLLDEQSHSPAPDRVQAPRPQVESPARAAPTTKSTGTSASGAMIEFLCTNCQNKMRAPAGLAGKNGKCPRCQTVVRIPGNSKQSGSGAWSFTRF